MDCNVTSPQLRLPVNFSVINMQDSKLAQMLVKACNALGGLDRSPGGIDKESRTSFYS